MKEPKMKLKNNVELNIKQAVKSDAKDIIEYMKIVVEESDNLVTTTEELITPEEEERFIEMYSASSTSGFFVGRIENEIVGVGVLSALSKKRIAHQASISISVKKEYWGLGIGTHLTQVMIDFARQNGQTEIINLGVKADNISAIKLYKKFGFVEVGRFKDYFKINGRYYDEITMNLYLDKF
ncbi:hypothetical protein AN639_00565 [Candidatus Epulonipiscium fishelsonii]|uniref:Uncharacterized protein n=1 Tax=Candidatus Epulonipiscium fishelsonii TaxID=77094 RepID=A0ACC8XBY9_9FIRM|nr:hypothetical protein AN396_07225 [Epulopiscium sp. SCG-B11WGA-EpuloA1]ONI41293.1 hypothetical protein AN639_00565 [Epulopiscium sp. SCG-B05WGA-EpuloA1]ONI47860.1 hypothetical protein AN644_03595 [Epulopiscium sp. SCG-C06WGA-EpuloA1]